MTSAPEHDFAIERRLRELDPQLHRQFINTVFALQYNLSNYQLIFPEFTDHTNLHSLTVIDFCNRLMGEGIEKLNADELYVLLMACYFHDTGMGITMKDYRQFSENIDFGDYFDTHPRDNYPAIIRAFHNEYSGQFIHKYADLFEFPSPEHEWAVIQVSRGHRKTDLMDEKEYPTALKVPTGQTICLPYLAAMVRLADEVDVAAARNTILLYDFDALVDEKEIFENKKVKAVRALGVTPEAFTLYIDASYTDVLDALRHTAEKMQQTLDTCRRVVLGRTPYVITQERVRLELVPPEEATAP